MASGHSIANLDREAFRLESMTMLSKSRQLPCSSAWVRSASVFGNGLVHRLWPPSKMGKKNDEKNLKHGSLQPGNSHEGKLHATRVVVYV